MKKAQGATEYLIILAVVVVIALILIGVLGGIPGIGGGAGSRTSDAYWSNKDVGITSKAFSASGADSVIVKNNLKNSVRVGSVIVGPTNISQAGEVTLTPGQTASIGNGNLITCTAQASYSYVVSITYVDAATGALINQTGAQNLDGTCTN
ncbi:MAG: hypothetical protein AABX51_04505 [Nanoarchaeota archaeon]